MLTTTTQQHLRLPQRTVVEHDSGHLLLVSHIGAATTPTEGGPTVHVANKHLISAWCHTGVETLIMLACGQGLLLLHLGKLPELGLHGAWRVREHSYPQHD